MKRICIFLCSLLVYGVSYAMNFQAMSCNGASTVTGPLGATTVTGYGTTVPTGSGNVTCNTCFYAGHLYVGNSYIDWYDTFSANGVQRIMYSDELVVYPGSILNNRFTWGNDMSGTFNLVNAVGWTLDNTVTPNIYWKVFSASATNIKYTESGAGKGMSLNTVGASALPSDRNIAGYAVTFDAASHTYVSSPQTVGPLNHHIQCSFVYPRWCGDGVLDTDKSELCDNGTSNGTAGNTCSATCQTVTTPTLACTNLTLAPTTLTKDGGNITATCSASNATQYKFVLKQNGTIITTKPYQTSNQTTFSLPANSTTSGKSYSVDCFVANATQTDITASACNKSITVPGTVTEAAICDDLIVSDQSISTGGAVGYECRTNYYPLNPPLGTTFSVQGGSPLVTLTNASGVLNFSTPGSYTITCAVNGANVIPDCRKSITVTTPQPVLPVCDTLDIITPGAITHTGGTITAVCSGTNTDAYKFVFRQGSTILSTIDYQSSASKTFIIPANTATTSTQYSVDCYAKNAQNSGVTSDTCTKSLSIAGAPVCNSLSVSTATAPTNTVITYICDATNATSYNILNGTTSIGTTPTGSMNFSTPGTYSIKCLIDGQTSTPNACIKSITITAPPTNPIPSIFIDKDDSTPGTPDTDGNDIQRVQNNGTATFTIRFTNNGNEALKTVVITDPAAPDCNRTSAQTAALYGGGATANFDVGETFSYVCTKTNVTSSTFPNNRNTASITGVGVTSAINVSDSDITEIFMQQINPNIRIEKNDTDNLDDTQEVEENGTARFSVKVTNNGDESLRNVSIIDELSPDCARTADETKDLIYTIGNKDSNFDPGEIFAYTCREAPVTQNTFPDGINTVCVAGFGIDTNQNVSDCDDTRITLTEGVDEPYICENIDSSEGSFGGAPFRTEITCQTSDESSTCEIEVSKNGDVINTYDGCRDTITFSTPGEYSVACIVDDTRSPDCEMGITVEAMTEIPTGTKTLLIILSSLVFAGMCTYMLERKRKLA